MYLDDLDRRLITHLKNDGRASITTLAGLLKASRATGKARISRLMRSGTIRRFTIELDGKGAGDLIHAVMMIELQGNLARQVVANLRKMPQIVSLHSTNGAWDLVARVETLSLADFDGVLREVREIKGVLNSETCLLLDRAI